MSGSYTYDSYVHFAGGMNSGFNAANLEPSQFFKGVNVTCRDGRISTRPSFSSMNLEFTSDWDQLRFQRGKFQGGVLYKLNGYDHLVTVISGLVFLVRADTGYVYNLSSVSVNLHQYVDRCTFLQFGTRMLVQDGISRPLIIEGLNVRVSDAENDEVPPGKAMAYGHGRLFIQTGPRAFRAGDIHRPNDDDAVLRFTEHEELALGGTLAVNQELGDIKALTFASNFDTSTGDGPLLAMCENGIVSFRVDVNRSKWLDTVFSKTQVIGSGPISRETLVHLNSDVLFWSAGGLRSFSVLKSEVTRSRRQVNLSREMEDVTRKETQWLLPRSSMAEFDGRVFATTGGYIRKAEDSAGQEVDDPGFQGLIAIDFDRMTGNALEGQYSTNVGFDGVWTGPNFSQIVASDTALYAFAKNAEGYNSIGVIDNSVTGMDDNRPIECRVITRAMSTKSMPDMQDAPFVPKLYDQLQLWADKVENDVPLRLWVATDNRPMFYLTAQRNVSVNMLNWETQESIPEAGIPQPFPALRFAAPDFLCNPGDGASLLQGYTFQFCLEWDGLASFSRLLFRATEQRDPPDAVGDVSLDLAPVSSVGMKNEEDFDYRSALDVE